MRKPHWYFESKSSFSIMNVRRLATIRSKIFPKQLVRAIGR